MAFKLFGKKKEEAFPELPENNTIPVSQVLNMKSQGMTNAQIANQLRAQGYSLSQIRDAISQAEIKSAVAPPLQQTPEMPGLPPMPKTPSLPEMPPLPQIPSQEAQMPTPGMQMPKVPELPPMPAVPPMPSLQPQKIPEMPKPHPQMGQPIPGGTEGLVNELQRIIEDIIEEKWKDVEDKLSTLDSWKARIEEKVSSLSSKVSELDRRVDDFSKTLVSKTEEYKGTMSEVNTQMEAIEKIMGKLVPGLAEEIKELRHVVEKMKKK